MDKRGFSLIELLIVIGILGVLAAVAIPAYNKYKTTATRSALTTLMRDISGNQRSCMLLSLDPSGELTGCFALSDLGVSCDDCGTPMADNSDKDYPFCVDAQSGDNQVCLSISSATESPSILNNWEGPICAESHQTADCSGGGGSPSSPTGTCPAGCSPGSSCGGSTSMTAIIPCAGGTGTPARGTPQATRACQANGTCS